MHDRHHWQTQEISKLHLSRCIQVLKCVYTYPIEYQHLPWTLLLSTSAVRQTIHQNKPYFLSIQFTVIFKISSEMFIINPKYNIFILRGFTKIIRFLSTTLCAPIHKTVNFDTYRLTCQSFATTRCLQLNNYI